MQFVLFDGNVVADLKERGKINLKGAQLFWININILM